MEYEISSQCIVCFGNVQGLIWNSKTKKTKRQIEVKVNQKLTVAVWKINVDLIECKLKCKLTIILQIDNEKTPSPSDSALVISRIDLIGKWGVLPILPLRGDNQDFFEDETLPPPLFNDRYIKLTFKMLLKLCCCFLADKCGKLLNDSITSLSLYFTVKEAKKNSKSYILMTQHKFHASQTFAAQTQLILEYGKKEMLCVK